MVHLVNKQPSHALTTAQTVAMFVLMIVYFRYFLGFFMRNFERQADAFAFKAMGSAEPLVRVFDKIAWLSGTSHDQPSWHHFSIGQRIDFLQRCEADSKQLHNHNRKIYGSLTAYLLILVLSALTLWKMPDNLMAGAPQEKYAQTVIQQKMADDPQNFVWPQLLGDLNYSRRHYQDAIAAYERSLLLNPDNAEVLNNLAWLLLTVDIHSIHNRTAALRLAKRAVIQLPAPHILDTLALAYFANGRVDLAIQTEKRAFALDPANRAYYIDQLKKFARQLK
jgi:tetratricopeptide (TPR) repeat protein